MGGHEVLAREVLGHGAYLCLGGLDRDGARHVEAAPIAALVQQLGLGNEFDPGRRSEAGSIAFLRRQDAAPGDIADLDLLRAGAVVHVASTRAETVDTFCAELGRLVAPAAAVRVLRGVVRPKNYTGAAMNDWAYARQVVPQPGPVMPNAFLVPLSKTADWWHKGWMERHTYFLPRYDDNGRMVSEGHALAAEAGITCLLRRTYRNPIEPTPDGEYDFLTYFECADAAIPVFHEVCAALRNVARNPEWRFVREGPTWHGRRVASWGALFHPAAARTT
jgi:hypothetical protein